MSEDDASTEDLISFEELIDADTVNSAAAKERTVHSPWPSLERPDSTERASRHGAATDTGKE